MTQFTSHNHFSESFLGVGTDLGRVFTEGREMSRIPVDPGQLAGDVHAGEHNGDQTDDERCDTLRRVVSTGLSVMEPGRRRAS